MYTKRFLFFRNSQKNFPWIGDQTAVRTLIQGMEKLGVEAKESTDPKDFEEFDEVVLTNINSDLTPIASLLAFQQKEYSLIPFHEDYLLYSQVSMGMFAYITSGMLKGNALWLEHLLENPEVVRYYNFEPKKAALLNYDVIKSAKVCIANTDAEAKLIQRDCPLARTGVVPWGSGGLLQHTYAPLTCFTKTFGLQPKNYILNVARLEPRKNQLALILALRHLDLPLVIVSNNIFEGYRTYANLCIELASRVRKAPTLILSSDLPPGKIGSVEVLPLPKEGGLSEELLVSAYQNASLYAHPAFFEQPGYAYMEAAKLGTPVVASKWGTLQDYFKETPLDDRISYVIPHHIRSLEKAILLGLNKSYSPSDHPSFSKSAIDIAEDFLSNY